MRINNIKKIILVAVIPLIILDTTLLYASQTDSAAGSDDELLDRFKQQLSQAQASNQAADAPKQTASAPSSAENYSNFEPTQQTPALAATAPAATAPVADASSSYTSPVYPSVQGYYETQPSQDQAEAFDVMAGQAMPMTPDQIEAMRRMMAASQRAAATLPETPAKPVTSSQMVSLAPGATPPVVRLSAGFISTIVFVDATGADWAISSIDNGNPDAFNISWDKKGNTLMIQSKKAYTFGNVAIMMKGLSTPVMLTLVPGQKEIDYRVDFRISGLSPASQAGIAAGGLPDTANNELLKVLDNIAPPDATLLKVSGDVVRAWLSNGKIYIRSRFVLLSPGYIAVMKSPDGTYAYEIQRTPSILVSQYGKPVELRVEGEGV